MVQHSAPRPRSFDNRFFIVSLIVILFAIVIGFGPTFYLKPFFNTPPIARPIIWVHGLVMAAWIALLGFQIYFVSARNVRQHQRLGIFGVGLAVVVFVSGLLTAVSAAKYGTAAAPPNVDPLEFLIVPFGDMIVFAILFAAAVYYRRKPKYHKRLILLTMIGFIPPAIARFPGDLTASFGPLWFFGVPTVLTVALIALDARRNRQLNKVFLFAGIFLILSMWLRLPISTTSAWLDFAAWLTA